jgi:hypothetical protein
VNSNDAKGKKFKNKWKNHKEKGFTEDSDSKNHGEGTSKKGTSGNKKKFNKKMSVVQGRSPRILMMRFNLHMLMTPILMIHC